MVTTDNYSKFKKITNMNYTELLTWSKTKCSKKASLNNDPIKRNLKLLKKPKSKWTDKDYFDAGRTIRFISRMKGVKRGKVICNGLSKRSIALRNWGYNDSKEE